MSTNWLHDSFFGSNGSAIEALEKLQKVDAEHFQKVFTTLKKLQEGQQFNAERIKSLQEHLNSLQERLANVEEKFGTLTETVADQEKIMLTYYVAASVIAVAAIIFIGFCIYQGIEGKREKEKEREKCSSDTSDIELDYLGPSTRFVRNGKPINLQVDGQDNLLQITHL